MSFSVSHNVHSFLPHKNVLASHLSLLQSSSTLRIRVPLFAPYLTTLAYLHDAKTPDFLPADPAQSQAHHTHA